MRKILCCHTLTNQQDYQLQTKLYNQQSLLPYNSQFITITPYFKINNDTQPQPYQQQHYIVNDNTTIQSIINRFQSFNHKLISSRKPTHQANQQPHQSYSYDSSYNQVQNKQAFYLAWGQAQNQFIYLNRTWQISHLKKMVGATYFNGQTPIRLYSYKDRPYTIDEASSSFEQFHSTNFQLYQLKQLQIPIKVINLKQINYTFYFYVNIPVISLFNNLFEQIDKYFQNSKSQLHYEASDGYQLKLYFKDQQEFKNRKWISQKQKKEYFSKFENNSIQLRNHLKRPIRQLCQIQQILILQLKQPQKATFKKQQISNNQKLVLQIFQYEVNNSDSNQILRKTKVQIKYNDVKNLKVSTFLRLKNIQNFYSTSIYYNGVIIRSFQKFSLLQNSIKKQNRIEQNSKLQQCSIQIQKLQNKNTKIKLQLYPQYLLFYKDLDQLSIKIRQKSVSQIIKDTKQQKIPIITADQQIKIQNKLINKIKQVQKQYKL